MDCVVVNNEESEELTIFAVNKDLEEDMEVTLDLRQFSQYKIKEHIVMHDHDLKAVNTEENPNRIKPERNGKSEVSDGILTAERKSKSWNVIRLERN